MGSAAKLLNLISAGAIWMGGAVLTLVVMFSAGPAIEAKYFPVTTNVEAVLQKVENDKMLFSAQGVKERDCSMIDARILVTPFDSDKPIKGAVWVVDDGHGPKTRALGFQDLGTWAVIPVGKKLVLEGIYKCHPLWETRQVLGTWEYENEKDRNVLPAR